MRADKPRARLRAAFDVIAPDVGRRRITLTGRTAWALGNLIDAGPAGCTPIDHPGPRWSHYVYCLRRDCGINVETVTEPHDGPFAGTHARYVLRTRVERADDAAGQVAA